MLRRYVLEQRTLCNVSTRLTANKLGRRFFLPIALSQTNTHYVQHNYTVTQRKFYNTKKPQTAVRHKSNEPTQTHWH